MLAESVSFLAAAPVGAVTFLNVVVRTTTAYIEWEAPYDPQLLITSFFVVYQLINTSVPLILAPRSPQFISPISASVNASVLIENLLQDSVYTVQVFSQTEMGNGVGSDVLTLQTLDPGDHITAAHAVLCNHEKSRAPWSLVVLLPLVHIL